MFERNGQRLGSILNTKTTPRKKADPEPESPEKPEAKADDAKAKSGKS